MPTRARVHLVGATTRGTHLLLWAVRRPRVALCLWGLALGVGVTFPWFGANRLFLLDWVVGPNTPFVNSTLLGLNGGLTAGLGGSELTALLNLVFGPAATWLPFLAFFPLAVVSAGELVSGRFIGKLAAGTLYAVNPFVFNRIYVGHTWLLIGYALLPLAVLSAWRHRSDRLFAPVAALWLAVLTSLAPHFAWIYGCVIAVQVVITVASRTVPVWRTLVRTGYFAVLTVALSAYIWLPYLAGSLPVSVTNDLSLYQSTPDPHLGLLFNLLALYGFWRLGPGPVLPKAVVAGWVPLTIAVLALAAIGAVTALVRTTHTPREDGTEASISSPRGRLVRHAFDDLSGALLVVGFIGLVLAFGDQGPSGGLYRWAYGHVPFFAVMREAQKFLILYALGLSYFFGVGVQWLITALKGRVVPLLVGASVAVLSPLALAPTIFDGLAGQVQTSHVPSSYSAAARLMGHSSGSVLILPWHLYVSYPFTGDRVVNDVLSHYVTNTSIVGDDVQIGTTYSESTSLRSRYLVSLFETAGARKDFGLMVAPLGVRYVALYKTADWMAFDWVTHQHDLKVVSNSPSLTILENLDFHAPPWPVSVHALTVQSNSDVALIASALQKGRVLIAPETTSRNRSMTNGCQPPQDGTPSLLRATSTIVALSSRRREWIQLPIAFEAGWRARTGSVVPSGEGTIAVQLACGVTAVTYSPSHYEDIGLWVFAFAPLFVWLETKRGSLHARFQIKSR